MNALYPSNTWLLWERQKELKILKAINQQNYLSKLSAGITVTYNFSFYCNQSWGKKKKKNFQSFKIGIHTTLHKLCGGMGSVCEVVDMEEQMEFTSNQRDALFSSPWQTKILMDKIKCFQVYGEVELRCTVYESIYCTVNLQSSLAVLLRPGYVYPSDPILGHIYITPFFCGSRQLEAVKVHHSGNGQVK